MIRAAAKNGPFIFLVDVTGPDRESLVCIQRRGKNDEEEKSAHYVSIYWHRAHSSGTSNRRISQEPD